MVDYYQTDNVAAAINRTKLDGGGDHINFKIVLVAVETD